MGVLFSRLNRSTGQIPFPLLLTASIITGGGEAGSVRPPPFFGGFFFPPFPRPPFSFIVLDHGRRRQGFAPPPLAGGASGVRQTRPFPPKQLLFFPLPQAPGGKLGQVIRVLSSGDFQMDAG